MKSTSLPQAASLLAERVQDATATGGRNLPTPVGEEASTLLPSLSNISLDPSSKLKITPAALAPMTNGNGSPAPPNWRERGQLSPSGRPASSQLSHLPHPGVYGALEAPRLSHLVLGKRAMAEANGVEFGGEPCPTPTFREEESRKSSLKTSDDNNLDLAEVGAEVIWPRSGLSPKAEEIRSVEASSMIVPTPSGPSSGRPHRMSQESQKRSSHKRASREDRASSGRIVEERWVRLLGEINSASSSSLKASDEDVQRCAILAMAVEDALEALFESAAKANLDVTELGKLIRDSIVSRRASSHELRRGAQATTTRGQTSYAFKHIQGSPGQLYDLMGEVGAGAFGSVRKATHLKTGEEHAVKCVPKAKVDSTNLWEEIEIMKLLDHPHIMRVYNTFEDDQYIYMCLELCTGGPFFDTLFRLGVVPESTSATLFKQVMNVLSYLHSRSVCHRDIKPENFLVLKKGDIRDAHLKLIDFGCSKRFDLSPMTTKICTPQYVAPEILLKGNTAYTEKVDVWSCGVMLYLMLSGRLPFHRESELEMLKLVKKVVWDFKPDSLWGIISDSAKELVRWCLCPVERRCSAGQALRSSFLSHESSWRRRLSSTAITQVQRYLAESRLKRVALRIIARQIDDESIAPLRNMFLQLDDDCTGTLSADEIQEAVAQMGVGKMKQNGMVELMLHLDPTGSGMIEYTEFLAATMTPEQYCKEDVCRAAFHRLDFDQDGYVTRKDLEKLVSHADGRRDAGLAEATLGEIFSEVDMMMKQADEDSSGGVSFEEFMMFMAEESQLPGTSACAKRKQRGRDYSLKEFMSEISDEEQHDHDEELDGDDSEDD